MLNRIVLIGRLCADPSLRYTPNGVAVTTFTLAVDRQFKNQNGETETDFINVVTWKGLAENCANYLKKGKLYAADGRLQIRNYEKDGKKVWVSEVVADNVRFLEKADSTQQTQNTNTGQAKASDEPFEDGKEIDLNDLDLPF